MEGTKTMFRLPTLVQSSVKHSGEGDKKRVVSYIKKLNLFFIIS